MKQIHPIKPLYSKNSKVLILGSFPSVKSREQMFFYSHPQNRFWKVLARVFECEVPQNIEQKKNLVLSNSLALWDVIAQCEITGSSDLSIKDVVVNDIGSLIKDTNIKTVFTNGKTAHKYYVKYIEPAIGIKAICLPSTSPANAGWQLDRLVSEWSVIRPSE